jgi:tetratricopeptide (TPR) repeat protein
VLQADELRAAEMHFRRTIELAPDYWDAHGALGYVLYKAGKFRDAADALEEAAQRDASNRGLRLLLGAAYAGLCRFDDARAGFKTAHDANVSDKDEIEALNTKTDWGQTLDEFGFHDWAMAEVSRVLAANPLHVDALKIRGEAKLAAAGQNLPQVGEALADLRAAVANDTAKSDAVLNAYLDALSRTTGADEAVSTYETWSQNGIVPALATSSIVDAVIIPDTRRTRRTYADALAKLNRLDSARRELDVLSRLGMVVEAPDADSQPHPANAPANVPESAPIFTHVSTRGEVAARECTRPNLAEPPLL